MSRIGRAFAAGAILGAAASLLLTALIQVQQPGYVAAPVAAVDVPKPPSVRRDLGPVHLVVSHWKEDLSWLRTGWARSYRHTVYEMGRPDGMEPDFSSGFAQWAEADGSRQYLINFADENSGYLRFIIDNYDRLPDVTVFLHGKPEAHNSKIGRWVRCLRDDYPQSPDSGFVFLTKTLVKDRCIVNAQNESVLPKVLQGSRQGQDRDYGAFAYYWLSFPWTRLGLSSAPQCVSFYCCGEFVASRAALQRYPLSFWKGLWSHTVDYILDEQRAKRFHGLHTRSVGGIYEHSWHLIFGESTHMSAYGPRYCNYFRRGCGPCADGL